MVSAGPSENKTFPREINIFSFDSLPSKYIIWISMSDHDTFYIETDIIEPKKGFH